MHILCEINTDPVTYPIDARQRWRLIPVLSHILCGQNTSTAPVCTCIYLALRTEHLKHRDKNILSFLSK